MVHCMSSQRLDVQRVPGDSRRMRTDKRLALLIRLQSRAAFAALDGGLTSFRRRPIPFCALCGRPRAWRGELRTREKKLRRTAPGYDRRSCPPEPLAAGPGGLPGSSRRYCACGWLPNRAFLRVLWLRGHTHFQNELAIAFDCREATGSALPAFQISFPCEI